jgi:uncharacterized LabA/DUF88 family protein
MIGKAAVLIDGGYIRALNRDYFGFKRIDFLKFSEELCKPDCTRFRTYYYICPPYQSDPPLKKERDLKSNMDKFLHELKKHPRFEIRLGMLKKTGEKYEQKGVDVLFACDLVRLAAAKVIDKAIIVSGDSDFEPAVKIAKEEMIITKLVYYPGACAPALFDACDERMRLTQDFIDSISF